MPFFSIRTTLKRAISWQQIVFVRAWSKICAGALVETRRKEEGAGEGDVRAAVFRDLDTPGSNLSFYSGRMFLVPSKNRTIRGQL